MRASLYCPIMEDESLPPGSTWTKPPYPQSSSARPKVFCEAALLIRLGLLVLIALHAFADPHPPNGAWGVVGVLAFQPLLRYTLLALCALLLIPVVARFVLGWCRRIWIHLGRHLSSIPVAVLVLLLVAIGWALRCQIPYGDGEEIPREIQGGQRINYKEPLDRLLTAFVYRLGYQMIRWDAATAIALVNTAVGAIFWVGLWRFVWRRKVGGTLSPWIVAGLVATTGVTQLLFGYVESYTFMTVGCLWTLFFCLEAVEDIRRPIWQPALAYGLTFASHLAAGWLAPALITTWALRQRLRYSEGGNSRGCWRRAIGEAITGVFVASIPIIMIFCGMLFSGMDLAKFSFATFGGGDGIMFVPISGLTSPYERFTMFSTEHLAAFFNQLLLVAPVGCVLAAFGWIGRRKDCRSDFKTWVLLAAAVGPVVYAFTFNPDMMIFFPDLGPMAEWDLLCLEAIPITLLGLWLLRTAIDDEVRRAELAIPAVAISTLHVAGWILFNAGIRI